MTPPHCPPQFAERMARLLPADQLADFWAACTRPLPRTFRVTAKGQPHFDPSAWGDGLTPVAGLSDVYSLQSTHTKGFGHRLEHWHGEVYSLSLSSLLPVLALGDVSGLKILDMCAAPGSKATALAEAALTGRGYVVANELSSSRLKKISANAQRLGLSNLMLLQADGTRLPQRFGQEFDAVLVDAPCSSEGFARRDPRYLRDIWSPRHIRACARLQRQLIVAGFRLLEPGGVMVYSTCTGAPEENEAILQHLLDQFPSQVTLEPLDHLPTVPFAPALSQWGEQSFHPSIPQHARRLWPHLCTDTWDSETFFVCRLRKVAPLPRPTAQRLRPRVDLRTLPKNHTAEHIVRLCKRYGLDRQLFRSFVLLQRNKDLYLTHKTAAAFAGKNHHDRLGLKVIDQHGNLATDWALAYGQHATRGFVTLTESQKDTWLAGTDIPLSALPPDLPADHQLLVRYDRFCLGVGKVVGSRLKNMLERPLTIQPKAKNLTSQSVVYGHGQAFRKH